MRRRYLVTYDISDDRRRDRVFKTLRDRGDHVQFSVFLCELNTREYVTLKGELQQHVHHRDDQVLILDLGPAENVFEIGQGLECGCTTKLWQNKRKAPGGTLKRSLGVATTHG